MWCIYRCHVQALDASINFTGGSSFSVGKAEVTNRLTDKETDGQHHCAKPRLCGAGFIISEKNVTERRETISHLRDEDAFISCIKRVATPAADSTLYTDTQLLTRLTTQLQLLSI